MGKLLMKPNPDFERMIFPAEFKFTGPGGDADESFVEGYANIFGNLDHNGDLVRPGAFKKTIQERVSKGLVPFLDSHQWDAAHTIGTVVDAREDHKGLHFRARLSNAPSAQDVRQKMLEGHIKRLSIGFAPVRESYERAEDTGRDAGAARKSIVRHLHEVKLFEVSAVPIAANEEATITNIKAAVPFQDLPLAEREREWDADAARKRVAHWAGGGEQASKINWTRYRRAFLWYDREKAEQVEGYKLPIADLINGELRAIPRAIFAAAEAVDGARGGAELGDDQQAVKANIERYYEKMAREFHDDSIVAPSERKSLDLIVLDARKLGVYDLGDIRAAAAELLGVLSPEDRALLIEELSAGPHPSTLRWEQRPHLLPQSSGRGDGDAFARLRRRASLLGSELTRRPG